MYFVVIGKGGCWWKKVRSVKSVRRCVRFEVGRKEDEAEVQIEEGDSLTSRSGAFLLCYPILLFFVRKGNDDRAQLDYTPWDQLSLRGPRLQQEPSTRTSAPIEFTVLFELMIASAQFCHWLPVSGFMIFVPVRSWCVRLSSGAFMSRVSLLYTRPRFTQWSGPQALAFLLK